MQGSNRRDGGASLLCNEILSMDVGWVLASGHVQMDLRSFGTWGVSQPHLTPPTPLLPRSLPPSQPFAHDNGILTAYSLRRSGRRDWERSNSDRRPRPGTLSPINYPGD